MYKIIPILLVCVSLGLYGFFATSKDAEVVQAQQLGKFGDPFISLQVGTSPTDGYVLQTNSATSTWVATSSLGITAVATVNYLSDIGDVSTSTLDDGYGLFWDGSNWLSTSTVFIASTTSYVGIGSTSPTSKLTVDGDVSADGVLLTLQLTDPTYQAGLLFYCQYGALNGLCFYDAEASTTLNIGKELWKDVRNCNSGSTILNGTAVYMTGTVVSQIPCVLPASATTSDKASVVGIATHDIENNSNGVLATFGVVNGINMSSFSDGDEIYLSTTTTGIYRNLTNVKPQAPFYTVKIGEVDYNHATLGKLELNIEVPHDLNDNKDIRITSPANNDVFTYDSSIPAWKNSTSLSLTGLTVSGLTTLGNASSTQLSVSGNSWFTGTSTIDKLDVGTGLLLNTDYITDLTGTGLSLTGSVLGVDLTANFAWTGAHDLGGATSLEIPNGASPTVNAIGEIALQTSPADAIVIATSTNASYPLIYPSPPVAFTVISSSTATTTIGYNTLDYGERIKSGICIGDEAFNIRNGDGTNWSNLVAVTTSTTTVSFTSNNTFNAGGEQLLFEVGPTASAEQSLRCNFRRVYEL